MQGRWSLTAPLLRAEADPGARRRALAELLLERYGVLTREQVLAEGIPGGFSAIYSELTQLEMLGVCRRGYFVEGLGGAQFALSGAVERLRAPAPVQSSAAGPGRRRPGPAVWRGAVLAREFRQDVTHGRRLRRADRRRADSVSWSAAGARCTR